MPARKIVNPYFFFVWLMEASVEDLMKCPSVGRKTAESIYRRFRDERFLETLRCLLLEPETRVTFEPWG